MHGLMFAVLLMAAGPQTPVTSAAETTPQQRLAFLPTPNPNAPPVIDMALRMVRAAVGGSSIARSAVRGDAQAYLYAGLGPCITGAAADDPARDNSITWRASGRVRSVERGIAVADVEWQRLEYRPAGVVAGSRVRTTLTLPLGERVAVDFVDATGSACRTDGLIFEIGVAPDHGMRLAMSGEGQSEVASGAGAGARGGGRGGGGGAVGRPLTPAELEASAERRRQAAEALRTASIVTRPMPPREYNVDVWLAPEAAGGSGSSVAPALAQRLSQSIGGTGGRFVFPPIAAENSTTRSGVVDISALVIPVGGDQLIVAITRHVTPNSGAAPVAAGWIKAVGLPKAGDVLSFEIPAPDGPDAAGLHKQGFGLSVRIAHR